MTKYFVKDGVTAKIVAENSTASITGSAVTALGSDGVASSATHTLYDGVGAGNPTYALISHKASVAINGFGNDYEEFTTVEDFYNHREQFRPNGSGTIEFAAVYDSAAVTAREGLTANQILYASNALPDGFNSLTGDAAWSGASDTAVTMASDLRGYAIYIAQAITAGSKYLVWVFHNCRISAKPSFDHMKRTMITLDFEDARYVSGMSDATTHSLYAPTIATALATDHYDA